MSGVAVIGALLRADAALTAVVPVAAIKAGRLPEGQPLPALVVRSVSLIDRQPLRRLGWCRSMERVAVTVRAASYRDQQAIMKLVRTCCAGRTGALGGAERVAVLTAGRGPDVDGPGGSFEKTQDFRVSFDAPV